MIVNKRQITHNLRRNDELVMWQARVRFASGQLYLMFIASNLVAAVVNLLGTDGSPILALVHLGLAGFLIWGSILSKMMFDFRSCYIAEALKFYKAVLKLSKEHEND
jgi:hypothetical protein